MHINHENVLSESGARICQGKIFGLQRCTASPLVKTNLGYAGSAYEVELKRDWWLIFQNL